MNLDNNTSQFPVSQLNFSRQIKHTCQGNETEIIISRYEDHFLVIATQIGTMGTIMYARKEEGVSINPTFNVSVIFGKRDEPMLVACARQLIEHMSLSGSSTTLVLSLGLKDHSVETLKGIVSAVIDNSMWCDGLKYSIIRMNVLEKIELKHLCYSTPRLRTKFSYHWNLCWAIHHGFLDMVKTWIRNFVTRCITITPSLISLIGGSAGVGRLIIIALVCIF